VVQRKYLNLIAEMFLKLHPQTRRGRMLRIMAVKYWVLLCTLALAATAPALAADEYIEYTGAASARQKADFLYGERHIMLFSDGRLAKRTVLYTCADGTPFARKKVSYVQPTAPDFYFDDSSNGMQEGVRSDGATRTMFFKANRIDAEKSAPLPATPGLVIDTGFDEFIQAHWNEFMRDSAVPLRFLVPSRLQAMSFVVEHLRSGRFDGRPTEVFRMKLSGILGLIFSGIDVAYDAADHRLVQYEGLSDLRDAAGDNLQANIVFPADARKPSSAQAMAAAQSAPLAPCH
jgi:hypothetical protein